MDAADEMFKYVDTSTPEWQAIYQSALDLGLDENTLATDMDAVKRIHEGLFYRSL